jgi:hypothetical protein
MEDELEREQQWRYIRPRWLGSKWWFGIQVVVWGIHTSGGSGSKWWFGGGASAEREGCESACVHTWVIVPEVYY